MMGARCSYHGMSSLLVEVGASINRICFVVYVNRNKKAGFVDIQAYISERALVLNLKPRPGKQAFLGSGGGAPAQDMIVRVIHEALVDGVWGLDFGGSFFYL